METMESMDFDDVELFNYVQLGVHITSASLD